MKATTQIFLSYARLDESKIRDLYQKLSDEGFNPWMDKRDLLPGERWKPSIEKAIRRSSFFLACLSTKSVNKRGFLQKEIRDALGIWQEMLADDIYLIPVRLEDCEVPEGLRGFQWVDLFEEDGWKRLVQAIQVGMKRREPEIEPVIQESSPSESHPGDEKTSFSTEMATLEKDRERVQGKDIEQLQEDYEQILDELARAIEGNRCVLFLGPACSETLELRQELGLTPSEALTQRTLICKLAEELGDEELQDRIDQVCGKCPDCNRCILPEVAAQYEEVHGRTELRRFIAGLLREGKPRKFHHQLWNLPFAAIYTVNYDELAILSRDGAVGVVTKDEVFATVSLPLDEGKIPFYKLHGSMGAEDVVITSDDQLRLRLAKQRSPLWKRLRWDLQSKVFLLVGYALGDMDVLEVIYSVHEETGGQRPHQSYAVIDRPMPVSAEREMRKYRIQTVQKDTDQFFEDLVERYRYLISQWSQISSTTPLEQRYPNVWKAFVQTVGDQSFSGLCLYGRSQGQKNRASVKGELRVIPTEMYEGCKRRQAQGEKILCVRLNFAQLGTDASINPWRFIKLLNELVRQLDNERSEVGLPPLDLADELEQDGKALWTEEAKQRVYSYWNRKYNKYSGKEQSAKVADAVDHPTREQQEETRRIRERYLTGQASDWFSWKLVSALGEYRLIVLVTDFQLIEPDDEWFKRVSQHLLNKLCEHNVGLIITRHAAKKFLAERTFAAYNLDRFNQIDLGEFFS